MVRSYYGFTIIELLVVMTVIALLSAMVITAVNIVKKSALRSRTEAAIDSIRLALEVGSAERAGTIAAVEHPLAGSAATRAVFLRAGTNAPLNTSGEALSVQDVNWVSASARDRVILRTDIFQGGASIATASLPLLYGVPRGWAGILGSADSTITRFRFLPDNTSLYWNTASSVLIAPYDGTVYKDGAFLFSPTLDAGDTLEAASARTLTYLFSQVGEKELLDMRSLIRETNGTLANGNRIRRRIGSMPALTWSPGRYLDSDGQWYQYRIRGSALYDAWGNEILVSTSKAGSTRIMSAGPDGVFRWNPGADGIYQTQPYMDPELADPSGDDRNGARDNIERKIGSGE